ncbi:glycosyltransferase family 4 protein [Prosthecomicrobium pneumaticum]|uniref:Glycosyltransferase involved in cell wall biosynthesis n=1 Tax=Prosthecomicrobium pneumaticum TaxID=81895 RepID=A0A7W9FQ94_9HYPH|nr:glycosyltransferase family 4 protein [Prosthecomicrobium pneumaticum]MBB5754888.1 glycosyltransferase involved in cell wall biosynthesis [Prosthecomicrobium pneumaticum]
MTGRRGGTFVFTADPVFPPVSGADLRNWRTVLGAARLGPVTAVSLWGPPPGAAPTPPDDITLATLSDATAAAVFRRPAGGTAVDLTFPEGWRERLDALLAGGAPQRIVIEHLGLAPLLALPVLQGARRILDMHNVESDLLAASEPLWRRLLTRDAKTRAVRAVERAMIAAVDEVWLCSAIDAARLARLHPGVPPLRVVPNAVPSTWRDGALAGEPDARLRQDGPRLLFVGHLRYRPNIAAALFLARRLLPLLRRRLPGATLVLAGRAPHHRVRALAGPGVTLVEGPDDLGSLYAAADVAAVPLRVGGGTRIKVLEAMAAGLPVVATALAVEGLDLEPGRHVLIAERPESFVAAIERLWRDADFAARQRAEARAHVLGRFGAAVVDAAIAAGLAGPAGRPDKG